MNWNVFEMSISLTCYAVRCRMSFLCNIVSDRVFARFGLKLEENQRPLSVIVRVYCLAGAYRSMAVIVSMKKLSN